MGLYDSSFSVACNKEEKDGTPDFAEYMATMGGHVVVALALSP